VLAGLVQAVHSEGNGEAGTIGEAFLMDGEAGKELYQWTKQDLEGDPISNILEATDDVSRLNVCPKDDCNKFVILYDGSTIRVDALLPRP
jgi:hypothetical protein